MNLKTELVNSIRIYFIVIAFFWLVAIYLLYSLGYHESFLFLNKHHSSYLDTIVPHLTQFGDSLILSSLVLIVLSFRNLSLAFTIVLSILLSGLALICLKQFLFPDWHRPLTVLGENAGIHYVKGHVEYYKAFPSGHATTIFSAFPLIALFFRQKSIQVLIASAAIVLSYTRIYLGSHFLGDVLAGSVLGTFFAAISLIYIYPKINNFLSSKEETAMEKISRIALYVGLIGFAIGISIRYSL